MPGFHRRIYDHRGVLFTAICAVVLMIICGACISCSSGETQQSEELIPTQEENAQALGRMMAHRNQLEGDLAEPVDVVISGSVTAVADAGDEMWIMVQVAGFRCADTSQSDLNATPGSELSIRLRKSEEAESIAVGDSLEINAMVSKSMEGPVVIGRAFRVVQ